MALSDFLETLSHFLVTLSHFYATLGDFLMILDVFLCKLCLLSRLLAHIKRSKGSFAYRYPVHQIFAATSWRQPLERCFLLAPERKPEHIPFATVLLPTLEPGVNLGYIHTFLGHTLYKTKGICTYVDSTKLVAGKSPLDSLVESGIFER